MKRYVVGFIATILCGVLCGCSSWMDGHYASVTPYQGQSIHAEKAVVEVTSASRIQDALIHVVEDGTESVSISIQNKTARFCAIM